MQHLGFIHDMMDVKILILFVAARVGQAVTPQQMYELCYQDDCVSYFDVCTALPELVASGHMQETEEGCYEITEKGKTDGGLTEDSIAFTVKQRAENAVTRFNRQIRRSSMVKTRIAEREGGEFSVIMSLDDEHGSLMTLELTAPNRRQANRLARLFEARAEQVYGMTMTVLLDQAEESED